MDRVAYTLMMRARSFSLLAIAAASAACASFSQFGPTGTPGGSVALSVAAAQGTIAPAQYDLGVTVSVHNGSDAPLRHFRVSLAFDGTAAAMSTRFHALESDVRGDVIAAGGSAIFAFQVEVLPSARLSAPILLDAAATWSSGGSMTGAATTATWTPQAPAAEIVVNSTADGTAITGSGLSLRSAILQANGFGGLRRITFDPTKFPPASPRTIVLNSGLPAITGASGDLLVVDGVGAGVRLTPAASETNSQQYMFRTEGPAVLADLTLISPSLEYPYFDLSTDGCAGGSNNDGGSLLAHAMTILEGITIDDTAVPRRNCYSSNIVMTAGSGHRILRSYFLNLASDVAFVDVPMVEFSDNRVIGSRNDVLGLSGSTGPGLRVVRNLFVGNSGNAVRLAGVTSDEVEIWNDTFANESVLSPIGRVDARPVNLRNDVFYSVVNAAIADQSGTTGTGLDLAHLYCDPSTSLSSGSIANAVLGTDLVTTPLGLTNSAGTDWASFAPAIGSPLIDGGVDLIDLNRARAGRWEGAGPDVGAVERGAVPATP